MPTSIDPAGGGSLEYGCKARDTAYPASPDKEEMIMRTAAAATLLSLILITASLSRAADAPGRYPFKSAVATYTISGEIQNGTEKLYIDDYGKKTRTERDTTMTIMGMTEKEKTLEIDDGEHQYRIDLETKTGVKMPSVAAMAEKIFANMSPEQKDAMAQVGKEMVKGLTGDKEMKPVGKDKVLGRECEIFEVLGSRTWEWKKLTLKMENTALGNMKQVATALKVDCPIPADTFKPPPGIELTEQAGMMPPGPPNIPPSE